MTATLLPHGSSSLTMAARSAAALLCTSHAACTGAHSSRSEKRTTQRTYLRALDTADMLPTGETREVVCRKRVGVIQKAPAAIGGFLRMET